MWFSGGHTRLIFGTTDSASYKLTSCKMQPHNHLTTTILKKCLSFSYAFGTVPLEADLKNGRIRVLKTKRFKRQQAINLFVTSFYPFLLPATLVTWGIYAYTNLLPISILIGLNFNTDAVFIYRMMLLVYTKYEYEVATILNGLLSLPVRGKMEI